MNDQENISPQALDLEKAVLGALMIEKNILDEIIGIITPEDFYNEAHQDVYRTILELDRKDEPIDLLTVSESLNKSSKLKDIGGPAYITQLISGVATADHITGHARIIKEKSLQRKLIKLGNNLIKDGDDPEDIKDLISFASNHLEEITESLYSSTRGSSFGDFLNQSLKEAEQRQVLANKGQSSGIRTPLADLTKATNGFQPGELIILAGRPSMGKSAFAVAATKTAAKAGKNVLLFSLEMKGTRLTDRILIGEADINPDDFKIGKLSDEDWQKLEKALEQLQEYGIHIFDSPLINIDYIRARGRVMSKKGKCDMIIIDYLGLIDSKPDSKKIREQEVAEISRRAKLMAMELNIPVILLSQLNRSCELRSDKRPHLSDLRESGAIEQDADLVAFLFRPAYYGFNRNQEGESLEGVGELIVAKNRNGRSGTIMFKHNESLTRIFDMPRPGGDKEPICDEDYKTRQLND